MVLSSTLNECTHSTSNEIYLIDENGAARYIHPWGTDPVPALFGHTSAIVEDKNDSLAMKTIYYFGGRLGKGVDNYSACPTRSAINGFCGEVYKLIVPSAPLSQTLWASSSSPGVFSRINIPFPIIGFGSEFDGMVFGNMIYREEINSLIIMNGFTDPGDGTYNKNMNFLQFDLNTNSWNPAFSSRFLNGLFLATWDGSMQFFGFESPEMTSKLNSLVKYIENPGGEDKILLFGGCGYTEDKQVVNYYETWFNGIASNQNEKVENVQEKLLDIFDGYNYCWTYWEENKKWIVASSSSINRTKTDVKFVNPDNMELNELYSSEIDAESTGCGISVSNGRIVFFNGNRFAITQPDEAASDNISSSVFGVGFCKGNKVGDVCEEECPLSFSFSKKTNFSKFFKVNF